MDEECKNQISVKKFEDEILMKFLPDLNASIKEQIVNLVKENEQVEYLKLSRLIDMYVNIPFVDSKPG